MKKIVVPGVFLAALSSPLFIEEAHANSVVNEMYVNVQSNSYLNIRKGPSVGTDIVAKLKSGTKVTASNAENGWVKVTLSDGKIGFANVAYLTSKQGTSYKYVSVNQNSQLNVRTAPTTSASILLKLQNNTQVEVLSEASGWAKIRVNGKEGFVSTSYLQAKKTEESKPQQDENKNPVAVNPTTKYVNVNNGSSLNMRNKPSTSGSIIVKLAKDVPVSVYSESNGWAKIIVYGKEGYVSSAFLSTNKSTTQNKEEEKQETVTKYVNVDASSSLNVRKAANTSSAVIAKLKRGEKVTVNSESNGWAAIKLANGTGYVSSTYLTTSDVNKPANPSSPIDENKQEETDNNNPPTNPVETEKPTEQVIKLVNVLATSQLNVREQPNTTSKIISTLKKDTEVIVLSEQNNWSQVKIGNVIGYVHSSYLMEKKSTNEENSSDEQGNTDTPSQETPDSPTFMEKIVNVQQGSNLNLRQLPSTSSTIIGRLGAGTIVSVILEESGWSKIQVDGKEGFVSSEFLIDKIDDSVPGDIKLIKEYVQYKLSLEEMTAIQMKANPQTDKLYDTYIREDAIVFKTSDATKGTVLGNGWRVRGGAGTDSSIIHTVANGQVLTILSKVMGSDGYYWYRIQPMQTWVNAKTEDTSYYLNPANFENDSLQSLQFLKLSSNANIDEKEVNEKILTGKGILAGKASSFITAANAYGINEIYLISHALLETGNGTSTLANGVQINGKTVYNMYGIGAYDGSAIQSGAEYAYNAGWFTPEAAIIGGARFIAEGYVNRGQDTLYKMRWNPDAAQEKKQATHQYATDIAWASKQVKQISNLYGSINSFTLHLEFPVYL